MPFRPEEIKEKRSPKDKCNRDPREDVIRSRTDKCIVVDFNAGMLALDFALLVEVV